MKFFFSSLRVRMMLLIFLTMIPAFLYILFVANEEKKQAIERSKEQAMQLVQLASKDQESYINETHNLLAALANNSQIRNGSYNSYKETLDGFMKQYRYYLTIAIARTDGNIIYTAVPTNRLVNISDRPYFKEVLNTRKFTIGEYQIGRVTGKPSLQCCYPVLNGSGDVQSVLIASLDLNWLSEQLSKETLPLGSNLTIRDRNGRILARYPDTEKWVGKIIPEAPIVNAMLNHNGEGMAESTGVDGVTRFYAFKQLDNSFGDIYLSVGIPKETAFASVNRMLSRDLIGLGVITLLMLFTAWSGINVFILRRINSLLSTTSALASGKMNVRTNIPYDAGELGQLANAFDNMAETLENREAKLRHTETIYRTLVEQIPAVTYVYETGSNGASFYVSPQIKTMLGFSPEAWADSEFRINHIHADDVLRVQAQVSRGLKNLEPYCAEYRVYTLNDEERWVHNEAVVIPDESGISRLMQGVMFDITERKRAEEALEAAYSELNQIFHATVNGVCVIDKEFNLLKVNKSFAQLTGVSREKAVGKKCYEVFPGPVCHTAKCTLSRVMKGESQVEYDIDKKMDDGTNLSCIITATPYRSPNGKIIGILEVVKDITERKQMEMEMSRYERLNLIGEMAAGIGHEIRNPMTTVRGFLQLLSGKKECAAYKDYFDLMIEELDRANSIITEFLSLAKSKPMELQLKNLNSIIETMLPLMQSDAINTDKYIKLDLKEIPDVPLDDKTIRQLILNLVRNGLEAMSAGGELTIKTFNNNEDVVFAVQDQGSGIDSEVLKKLGTPFFTTKDNGTGLGLAVCYKIAASHNASLEVKSNQDGTTFFVRLKAE